MSEKELLEQIAGQVQSMHRGIYGDPENGTKGLIERQNEDDALLKDLEKRMVSVETFKKNTLRAWGAFWGTMGFSSGFNWDKVLEILHLK